MYNLTAKEQDDNLEVLFLPSPDVVPSEAELVDCLSGLVQQVLAT